MKNKNEESLNKMSYESDGKMGKNKKQQQGKRNENDDFFNSTQNSE